LNGPSALADVQIDGLSKWTSSGHLALLIHAQFALAVFLCFLHYGTEQNELSVPVDIHTDIVSGGSLAWQDFILFIHDAF